MVEWYRAAMRAVRDEYEAHKIGYTEAVGAIDEVGEMIGRDADLHPVWRATA
jgi:hypothetical protein